MKVVYRYGLRAPTCGQDVVFDQLAKARHYRNALVEVERARRAALRKLMLETDYRLDELQRAVELAEEQVGEALEVVKAQRRSGSRPASKGAKATPKRSESPEAKQALKKARAARKQARSELHAYRRKSAAARQLIKAQQVAAARPDDEKAQRAAVEALEKVRDRQVPIWVMRLARERLAGEDEIHDRYLAGVRQARAHAGLYSGNEQVNRHAMEASFSKVALEEDPSWSRHPGQLGVIIDGGQPPLHHGRLLQIEPVDERAWWGTRSEQRRLNLTTLRMRVQSNGRDPVWAEWPMRFHRPFPKGARVTRATVNRKRVADRWRWSVSFTLDCPDGLGRPLGSGAVALEVGWRQMAGDVRVAVWCGYDGRRGELWLDGGPSGHLDVPSAGGRSSGVPLSEDLTKADAIRATRDKNRDDMKAKLLPWMRSRELPEWLRARTVRRGEATPTSAEACAYLAQWRAPARFVALMKVWKENRMEGDDLALGLLEAYCERDRHLWQYEAGRRKRAIGRRNHLYERFAVALARQYGELRFQNSNLADLARRPEPDAKPHLREAASRRVKASPGDLREAVVSAFSVRGGEVDKRKPDGRFSLCWSCERSADFDRLKDLSYSCPCGITWDQDENTCRRLLNTSRDDSIDGKRKEKESRAKRIQRQREWKEARRATARHNDDNAAE